MELWIVDTKGVSDADIERACGVAQDLIEKRGHTVAAAYQAVMNRFDGKRFNPGAVRAWDAAEEAALGALYGDDPDNWPDGPVLAPGSERPAHRSN